MRETKIKSLDPYLNIADSIKYNSFFFNINGICLRKVPKSLEISQKIQSFLSIGHGEKRARTFFAMLLSAQIDILVDVRRNAKFSRAFYTYEEDLAYFLELHKIAYLHIESLGPEQKTRDEYYKALDNSKSINSRKDKKEAKLKAWAEFEQEYLTYLTETKALAHPDLQRIFYGDYERIAFLCSEHQPHYCHRRLLMETIYFYLNEEDKNRITFQHLVEP